MESSALVYVILTIVTVFLAFYVQSFVVCRENGASAIGVEGNPERVVAQSHYGMTRASARSYIAEFAIFCLLTGVSACRIAVGNDYWVYRFNFRLIAQERHVSSEFGFNYIVKWMQQLFGYDNYLPIFAYYSFPKKELSHH